MKPPRIFNVDPRKHGYSECLACGKFKFNLRFRNDKIDWILCELDYVDYWENTDHLSPDYKVYP